MDITIRHPAYLEYEDAWRIMRDTIGGEDVVKDRGLAYLPLKSAQAAMTNATLKALSYNGYRTRAEFPEIVAPTITGHLGLIHAQPITFELPPQMEPMLERATADGLTLEDFAERISSEILAVGRFGILPTFDSAGAPLLAGFTAEAITSWDAPRDGGLDYVVLDESANERDPATNQWIFVERFRELAMVDGIFVSRTWIKSGGVMKAADDESPTMARTDRAAVDFMPFVLLGTRSLGIDPDDVPLYGLAKIALRMYRLDADYMQALHMTSEPTPYITGFDDANRAIEEGRVPSAIGAANLWVLPTGSTAGFLEFSGPGLDAQRQAIDAAREAAATFGAQMFDETTRAPESGQSRRARYDHNTSSLKTIAKVTAAGLERALKNQARWMGLDEDAVSVTPNLDWVTDEMTPAQLTALVKTWQEGVISYETLFDRMQAGKVINAGRTMEDEIQAIIDDPLRSEMEDEPAPGSPESGVIMPPQQQPQQQQPIET